jgi:hypothetical protein
MLGRIEHGRIAPARGSKRRKNPMTNAIGSSGSSPDVGQTCGPDDAGETAAASAAPAADASEAPESPAAPPTSDDAGSTALTSGGFRAVELQHQLESQMQQIQQRAGQAPASPTSSNSTTTQIDGGTRTETSASQQSSSATGWTHGSSQSVSTDTSRTEGGRTVTTNTQSQSSSSVTADYGHTRDSAHASIAGQYNASASVSRSSGPTGGPSAEQLLQRTQDAASGGRQLYSREGQATLYNREATFGAVHSDPGAAVQYSGQTTAGVDVSTSGSVRITSQGAVAHGQIGATAGVTANYNASYSAPPVSVGGVSVTPQVNADVTAFAGVTAQAQGTLAISPRTGTVAVGADAHAFAGVSASAHATGALTTTGADGRPETLASATVTATGQAGAGAEAHFHLGIDHGTLTYSMGAGACLGVGGDVGVQGSVNLGAVAHAAEHAVENVVKDEASSVLNGLTSLL